jgi:hypothetical protein
MGREEEEEGIGHTATAFCGVAGLGFLFSIICSYRISFVIISFLWAYRSASSLSSLANRSFSLASLTGSATSPKNSSSSLTTRAGGAVLDSGAVVVVVVAAVGEEESEEEGEGAGEGEGSVFLLPPRREPNQPLESSAGLRGEEEKGREGIWRERREGDEEIDLFEGGTSREEGKEGQKPVDERLLPEE